MRINYDRLTLELARQRITVNDRCKKAGVSYPAFQKISAGKQNPKPITVGRLAHALGIDPAEIIKQEEKQ